MATCFKDPGTVVKSAFEQLVPGGYLEFQDIVVPLRAIDETIHGTHLGKWQDLVMGAAAKMGMSWKNSSNYVRYFEEAGFVDVVEKHFQWPINTWPKGQRMKTLGNYYQEDLHRGMEGMSLAVLTRGLGMTREEVVDLTAAAKKDLFNKGIHAYLPM